jgi:hypothetical protein
VVLRRDAGFALADALTGLTILAATIVLSINAAATARRASLSALEYRQAARALDQKLLIPFAEPGSQSGVSPAPWRVSLAPDARLSGSDAEAPCRRSVTVSIHSGGRSYTATTLETCPAPKP